LRGSSLGFISGDAAHDHKYRKYYDKYGSKKRRHLKGKANLIAEDQIRHQIRIFTIKAYGLDSAQFIRAKYQTVCQSEKRFGYHI
jgi:hypothetical protein